MREAIARTQLLPRLGIFDLRPMLVESITCLLGSMMAKIEQGFRQNVSERRLP
jgi:hypothetical protein